jgi:hypothetical protein
MKAAATAARLVVDRGLEQKVATRQVLELRAGVGVNNIGDTKADFAAGFLSRFGFIPAT